MSWEKLFYQLHYRQCHGRSYFTHWTTGSVTGEAISPITLPVVLRKGENLIALPGCTWGEKRKLIFTIKIITSITKCMFYSTLGSQTQKRDCVVYQASRLLCMKFFFSSVWKYKWYILLYILNNWIILIVFIYPAVPACQKMHPKTNRGERLMVPLTGVFFNFLFSFSFFYLKQNILAFCKICYGYYFCMKASLHRDIGNSMFSAGGGECTPIQQI